MNLGSWVLTGYSGILFLTAVREWRRGRRALPSRTGVVTRTLFAVLDAAGVPLALLFSGYTGVLLSATSTPVWCENPWLGALFSASAFGNGASALTLALERKSAAAKPALEALEKIDTAAHVAEIVMQAGYLAAAGELARPLTQGKWAPLFWGATAGVVAAEVLKHLPTGGRTRRWTRVAGALAGLAGGFALKWAVLCAGHDSAGDPEADRQVSRRHRALG
jgi:formate-dependent nitrite reductase membrane component NrfD